MAQNVVINGVTYSNVPEVDIPKSGSGTAKFYDTADADITSADVLTGKTGYGSSGWTLLYTGSVTANTTGTSATSLKNLETGVNYTDKTKLYLVTIRGDSGKRSGYVYGSDTYMWAAQNSTYQSSPGRILYYTSSAGVQQMANAAYGVYVYRWYYTGQIRIYTRYSSTYGTINDTFTVKVWSCDFPTGTTPAA